MGVTKDQIIQAVCDVMGISEEEILGQDKHRRITRARYMAMYLVQELVEPTATKVAHMFNRADWSAMRHCRSVTEWRLDHEPAYQKTYSDILVRLTHKNRTAA